MIKIAYPTNEEIIEYNKLVLENIKVKKADKPQVLSEIKLLEIISNCKKLKGDIYDKAVILLINLVRRHPFASGNRRTALFTAIKFLIDNNVQVKIKNDPIFARVLTGIREGFYSNLEVHNWLKNGKIREFKR